MAQYLLDRLNEYKRNIEGYNPLAKAEEQIEGNYNSIDGIIGNSDARINIKYMISEYQKQIGSSGQNAPEVGDLERKNG